MKIVCGLIVFCVILLQPLPSNGQTDFTAQLERLQAVPPVPASEGIATFSLNDDATELSYDIRESGIPAVAAAHFHNAPSGENGGVVRELTGEIVEDVWVSAGVWSSGEEAQPLTAELIDEWNAGNIYINVHTADYGAGEIRGQVDGLAAVLGRDQAVPPIPPAAGSATFTLSDDGTELTYQIRVVGVPAVAAAHFHNAPMGDSGGVVRGLSGDFEDDVWVSAGVWSSDEADQSLTAQLVDEINAGNIYVNVHTADYGAGEIRGQILSDGATAVVEESWGTVKGQVGRNAEGE